MPKINPASPGWLSLGIGAAAGLVLLIGLTARRQEEAVDLSVFDSPDQPGSGSCMDPGFIRMLREVERMSAYPVFANINSGARSPAHNRKVGGAARSSHLIPVCRAADIHTPSREVQKRLVRAAVAAGFRRIGIGRTFIHLDNDPAKSQGVAWGYPSGAPPPFDPFG